MERDVPVDLLVNAVLDGRPVDWDSAESSASSEDQRAQIRHFRTLAALAALHRESEAAQTELPAAKADLWGPLRLLERVGDGTFGDVFRAWDTKLAREVALKLIRHRESTADWSEDRALEEGRLLARIRHPNVVTVFGADRIGDRVGIWMEFIRGRTLQQVLRTHGALSAREAATIGLDLCLALSAVHRAGLLHRDVKAQNVMREDGGRIVLMDFGAGRENLDDGPAEFAGTPLYLAPEVFGGLPATVRSDLYSLGVLLYHLVTSSYPVCGRTAAEIRSAHGQRRRTWLRDERPDLPDKFVQAVERALEFDPDARYESAGAMEAALARLASASDSALLAAETPSAIAMATAARPRFSRARWIAGAALAAAAVAVAISGPIRSRVVGWRGGSPPGRSAGGAGLSSSEAVRKVTLPEGSFAQPSPDGKFFSLSDSSGNVAVLELATGQIRRVTNEAVRGVTTGAAGDQYGQYAESSAMSADSQFVAYVWYALDGKYELRVVDIDGKRPRVLLRSDAIDYSVPLQWSRDGRFILSTLTRPDLSVQLALVSVEDGTARPIRELGVSPHYASLSPDGQFVVYDAPQQRAASARDVFIVRADGSDDRHLIDHPANDRIPVWTPDGRRVLFASDRSGTTDVWALEVDGGLPRGEPQMVHRNIGRMWLRGLTDTGSYFYEATIGTVDVYEASLADGVASNPTIVPTSYSGSNLGSVWSPDGQRLAYVSRRGLPFDRSSTTLVIRDLQTQEQRELVLAMNSFLPRSWLPDGRHIVTIGVDPRDRWGIYQIDVDTGRTTPIVLSDRPSRDTDIGAGYGMPDGRVLYFNGAKRALLARSVQTGVEEVVFDLRAEGVRLRGGSYRFSPDGQTLALTAFTQQGETQTSAVVVKRPGAGPSREIVRAQPSETVLFQDWTPDGQALLFTRWTRTSEPSTLWRASIHGGDPQPLNLSMVGLRGVSANPDGTKITFTAGWPMKELWVMENFLTNK